MINLYLILSLVITLLAAPVLAEELLNEEQKTLYAIGLSIARSLTPFSLTADELEIVKKGITDAVTGKTPAVDFNSYNTKIRNLGNTRRIAQAEKVKTGNVAFFEKAANEKRAVKSDTGMVYLSLKEGSGLIPGPGDSISINYRGTLPDGKEFTSNQGIPKELKLTNTILKCWNEGLQKMRVGGKALLSCPPALAYGENGGELVPPGVAVAFEIELLDVKKEPQGSNHQQL
jgi:FKBP-type peptidyl-prolyl cis-trans isomerase FkpA